MLIFALPSLAQCQARGRGFNSCYYYLGRVKPTDQERAVIKKIVCYSQFPKRRGHAMLWGATWRSARVGQEAEGVRRGKRG